MLVNFRIALRLEILIFFLARDFCQENFLHGNMVIIASSAIIIAVTVWSLFLGVMTISKAALSSHSKKDQRKKETCDFAQQQNGNHANKTKEASLDGGKHRPSPSPGTTNVSMEHRSGKKEHR